MERRPCPERNKDCFFYARAIGCRLLRHHIYWPDRDYAEGEEQDFRNLEENRVDMCAGKERLLHLRNERPDKPPPDFMQACLARAALKKELGA